MKEFRLVALGDSLTYGYGVLSHIAFPARLAAELPEKCPRINWKIYNRGINGETTREAKLRLAGGVLRLKPHICTILLGSNDSALNEGQYRTLWEYENNLRLIIESLLAEAHGDGFHGGFCLPLLITPPPVVDTDFYPFTTTDRLEKLAEIVRKLAAEYQLPLVDVFHAFTAIHREQGFDAYDALFQFDGVHWSNHGYEVFYPLLEEKLLELTKEME
ncbi:MAG: GDSL-type esterase/lipase family protein [Bacillota bacterium]|nr:GDSL-type esterase/lipase family protein [Bacillota bacterium]